MINIRDEELCRAFGANLKLLRKSNSLSQEMLANKADVSLSQISRLERGLLNPTLSTLLALSKALEIEIHEIVQFQI